MDIMTTDNILIRHSQKSGALGAVWLVHGFGESGGIFTESFSSVLAGRFSLFAPDFPGYGASPFRPESKTIAAATQILVELIEKFSGNLPVFLVAHSLGGIIATGAAARLGPRVRAYANIEGNLTKDDTFVTGLSAGFTDAEAFKRHLIDLFLPAASEDEILLRWVSDLSAAHPEALLTWARECVSATGEQSAGQAYRDLACRTLYLWGEKTASKRSRDFLEKSGMDNRGFAGCGHLPMVEKPDECWGAVSDFFTAV
ncbi:MAG: alpha/beta hydrolase [Deltaproteobacteria bacterium]|nr:alpha/beta hydrolase [Candidatus Zymogenaceae bacterium]